MKHIYTKLMQLNKFTDLSLRVLMYLTQETRSTPITISEIAQQFNVPRSHLVKIVTRLNKLALITATRGRTGGLKLNANPSQLKLGNVIKELENSKSLVNCNTPPCILKGRCRLKEALDAGLNHFYDEMNKYSLQDIADDRTQSVVISLQRNYASQ
jgi:Rrf2 family nitric oxide-sensitive transcriptional repressor